jgi:hypothetical protein
MDSMGVVGDATTRGLINSMVKAVEARGPGGEGVCEYARSKVASPLPDARTHTSARTHNEQQRKEEMRLVTCIPLFLLSSVRRWRV